MSNHSIVALATILLKYYIAAAIHRWTPYCLERLKMIHRYAVKACLLLLPIAPIEQYFHCHGGEKSIKMSLAYLSAGKHFLAPSKAS